MCQFSLDGINIESTMMLFLKLTAYPKNKVAVADWNSIDRNKWAVFP